MAMAVETPTESSLDEIDTRLRSLFGDGARREGPLAAHGVGLRLHGIDLRPKLSEPQVAFLLDQLSRFRVLSIAGQDLEGEGEGEGGRFSLAHLERFANHWGAVMPHPNNMTRAGKPAQADGDCSGALEVLPFERRAAAAADAIFPHQLQCLPHESPTVLVAANFGGAGEPNTVQPADAWHTDIEYEPLPMYVSIFLVHKVPSPSAHDAPGGTWVTNPGGGPYFTGSAEELTRLRNRLPLNGETAFADTVAAFEALPSAEQEALMQIRVRRRLNAGDEGWLAPLVVTNPRSGLRSLHSPFWASRPNVRPPVEVDGMTREESRAFLDRLEAHVLQPQFRYDHVHSAGDVTLWDNYMTVHNRPPLKTNVTNLADARLLYRLSCKGLPSLSLPRNDAPEWLRQHIAGGYTTPAETLGV